MAKVNQLWMDNARKIVDDYCDGALIYEEAHNKLAQLYGGHKAAKIAAADDLEAAYGSDHEAAIEADTKRHIELEEKYARAVQRIIDLEIRIGEMLSLQAKNLDGQRS